MSRPTITAEPMLVSPDCIVFGPDRPISSILDGAQHRYDTLATDDED